MIEGQSIVIELKQSAHERADADGSQSADPARAAPTVQRPQLGATPAPLQASDLLQASEVVLEDAAGQMTAQIANDLHEGTIVAGKYKIEQVIGKGGMGLVLRARHIGLDEVVAIKVLRASMLAVPGMVQRFLREARAASKIKSEHVGRVTDVDTLPSGVPYMVMEYLEGSDLYSLLRKRVAPLSIEEAARMIHEACDAIADAHAHGIVHRDLKPANLFLARRNDGRDVVKVLDFGISKLQMMDDLDATKTGQLLGSPKYMSPEQMTDTRNVDGRADIWALGAILYECITGRAPFMAQSTALICSLVLNSEPRPPRSLRPELPEAFEAIILRCLQKDRHKRFATVKELNEALLPFLEPSPRSLGPMSASVLLDATPAPAISSLLVGAGSKSSGGPEEGKKASHTLWFALALLAIGVALGMKMLWGDSRTNQPTTPLLPAVSANPSPAVSASTMPSGSTTPLPAVRPSATAAPKSVASAPTPAVTVLRAPASTAKARLPSKLDKDNDPFGGVRQMGEP